LANKPAIIVIIRSDYGHPISC